MANKNSDHQNQSQAETKIAEMQAIIKSLTGDYWLLTQKGNVIDFHMDASPAPFSPFFLDPGDRFDKLLPEETGKKIIEAVHQAAADQQQIELEYHVPIQTGEEIYLARIVPLGDGRVVMSNRNITERVRLESIAHSVDLMHNFGFIFSGIRHEIGNPINSIKMTVSVLRNSLEKYSRERIIEYIDRVLSDINRVEYLLNSLKSYNMFEKLTPRPVSVRQFMGDMISLVKNDFQKRGIRISLHFHSADFPVRLDPRALHQVMLNLLNNAADSLEGRPGKRIDCSVHAGETLTLIIEDNGCGITDSQQHDLFRPFFTTKPHGTGLGLVIVRKLLTEMNGSIQVQSREKIGTKVIVTLPLEMEPGDER